jgi:hypothetical protein
MLTDERRPGAGSPPQPSPQTLPATPHRNRATALADALLERRPVRWLDVLGAGVVLVLVAALAYGSHVRDGGFIMDDWSNAAKTQALASCCGPGATGAGTIDFLNVAKNMLHDGPAGYHVGLTVLVPPAHFFFGMHMGAHLALGILFAVMMSLALFALLRTLGLARLHSGVIAILVLLFPFADSVRLWAMASYNQLAVVLFLVGAIVALWGLRQTSRARAVALHAVALTLYAAGILIYELVGGAVLLAVILYLGRAGWRGLAVRWVADIAVAALALRFAFEKGLPRGVIPWDARIEHARIILDQSVTLLARVIVPFGEPGRLLVLLPVLAVIVAAVVMWRRTPGENPTRHELARWLVISGLAVVAIGAGYAAIVPAFYGAPLNAGIENRVNMMASVGWVTFAYAVAMLAGLMIARAAGKAPRLAVAASLAVSALMAVGYLTQLADSKAAYAASWNEQEKVLSGIGKLGPYVNSSTIYVFGQPGFTAPGVPVYAWVWDLNPAAKVWLRDVSVQAHPMLPETEIVCNKDNLHPMNRFAFGPGQTGFYGTTYFVDVERGFRHKVKNQRDCEQARARFKPGPLVRGRDCTAIGGGPATQLSWTCKD